MKELRNMKGITLIALVITIVILLLLAGVTIAMLTGENGILTKAQNAKGNWNAKQAKEQIELVVTDAKIHNNGMSINKQILKDGLIGLGVENLPENAEDITFDLSVTLNNYLFKIYENGKVEQVTGIQIPSSIKLIPGETIEINVDKSEDVSGTVTWNVENENITTIDTDTGDIITVTAKGVGETLITATIQTNGTTYTAECNVKVVAAITSLNLSDAEVQSGNTVQLQVTKTPQGETENVIFESSNPEVLTVDNNGLVTAKSGITEDTTVNVTAKPQKTAVIQAECTVTVKKEDESNKKVGIIDKSKTKFASNNNVREVREGNIPIPSGFYYVKGSIIGGAVITDVSSGKEGEGNEFVWVPVTTVDGTKSNTLPNGSEIELNRYTFDGAGKPRIMDSSDQYVEEDGLNGEATNKGNLSAISISDYKKSVKNYGGYYIGRYEARDADAQEGRTNGSASDHAISVNVNNFVYNYVTQSDAARICRTMNRNNAYTVDLTNSYAWDTAILYIQECSANKVYSIQASNSSSYSDKGTPDYDTLCNIVDMRNNCVEWTTEKSLYYYGSTARGGNISGQYTLTTSGRYDYSVNATYCNGGGLSFRPILYIN